MPKVVLLLEAEVSALSDAAIAEASSSAAYAFRQALETPSFGAIITAQLNPQIATVSEAVETLEEFRKLDPNAYQELFNLCVCVDQKVCGHSTLNVTQYVDAMSGDVVRYEINVLDPINAILRKRSNREAIVMMINDDKSVSSDHAPMAYKSIGWKAPIPVFKMGDSE